MARMSGLNGVECGEKVHSKPKPDPGAILIIELFDSGFKVFVHNCPYCNLATPLNTSAVFKARL